MKLLFVYEHSYPDWWRDGLWAAIRELEKRGVENFMWNIAGGSLKEDFKQDFTLGWGAFNSNVDRVMLRQGGPKGLCIAGNAYPPHDRAHEYDVLFYETDWYRSQLDHTNTYHAFGVNTDIYFNRSMLPIWDIITVGAFALWKRQHLLLNKPGFRLAVGEIQQGNLTESMGIINDLVKGGVAISGMTSPTRLSLMYNQASSCYIPCDINGGGERAVLEARACGIPVEVESDNPKLKELCYSDIYDHIYYADQLEKGINSCL